MVAVEQVVRVANVLGKRCEAADVVVDLVDFVVFGRNRRRGRVLRVGFDQRLFNGKGFGIGVDVGVEQVGRAASQQRHHRYAPLLAVEAQVLAEVGVVDLDKVGQLVVLGETTIVQSQKLLGLLDAVAVGGQLQF